MISQKTLEKYKLDSASLEKLFTAKKKSPKIEKLIELIAGRNNDGANHTLRNYRPWAAVDLAYDAPFSQETPTLLKHIMATCGTEAEMIAALSKWGLSEETLLCKVKDKKGNEVLEVNAPLLFTVIVPFMRGMFSARMSKIYNDFNTVPQFPYVPRTMTELNRLRCDIWTDLAETMATNFGYAETKKQFIFNMLLYSEAIKFPLEPWHEEIQEDEHGDEIVEKQGVRYVVPHKNRTFCDLQHPLATMNTNTGCSFAGYITILRWGDVQAESRYWNTKEVGYGTDWFSDKNTWSSYLKAITPSCVQKFQFPQSLESTTDRESYTGMYTESDHDKAVFVVNSFHRLIPNDWGLGDYKHPVWFKFTTAADRTVIWAESYSYNPLGCALYDPDQNRVRNASLGLELIPPQDIIGNIMNQWLLTMKRNLTKVVFCNTDQIPKYDEMIEAVTIRSHWLYQQTTFVGYSQMKERPNFDRQGSGGVFQQVDFGYSETSSAPQAVGAIISLWERIMGMSAQEAGAAASHQQGNPEIQLIAQSSSNRVTYTASGYVAADYAWKHQMHEAILAHMPDDVESQVSANTPDLEKRLEEMGFKVDGKADGDKKVKVKGKKASLKLEGFASASPAPNRSADQAAAQAEYLAIASMNNNPRLAAVVKVKSLVELTQNAARKGGADPEFKVEIDEDALAVQSVQQALPQIAAALEKDVVEKIIEPMAKREEAQDQQMNQLTQEVVKMAERLTQLSAVFEAASAAPPLAPVQPINPQPQIPIETGIPPLAGDVGDPALGMVATPGV